MGVEEVDMAVPVDGSWREPGTSAADAGAASLLAEELRSVVQGRRRPTLTARQRARRARDVEGACKRLAKRLASELAGKAPDRQLAETLRLRTYAEVLGMLTVLRNEWSHEAQRAGALLRWSLGLAGGLVLLGLGAAWAGGWIAVG